MKEFDYKLNDIFIGISPAKVDFRTVVRLLECHNIEPTSTIPGNKDYKLHEKVSALNARAYNWFTSKLYPLEVFDNVDSAGVTITEGELRALLKRYGYLEAIDSAGVSITEGELRALLKRYGYLEAIDSAGVTITEGELRALLHRYEMETEAIESAGVIIQSGSLEDILIRYTNWPTEAIDSAGVTIISGTLEEV